MEKQWKRPFFMEATLAEAMQGRVKCFNAKVRHLVAWYGISWHGTATALYGQALQGNGRAEHSVSQFSEGKAWWSTVFHSKGKA